MDKDYSFTGYQKALKENVRRLRKNMTRQEKRLWYDFLRSYPVKIYRQRVIDRFVVDFYCSAARLVIEIDGAQHFSPDGKEYDEARTAVLRQYKLDVIRFTNHEIDTNYAGVCQKIDTEIQMRIKACSESCS